MSHQSTTKVLSTSRIWSHNTNYTGAAGIHSEEGPAAHARNNLMDKRSAAAMTNEEEILKKKMKSLSVSRKSLETSMLSYSQKMKDIVEKREQLANAKLTSPQHSPDLGHSHNNNNSVANRSLSTDNPTGQRFHMRHSSIPCLPDETSNTRKLYPASVASDPRGRVSADSGLGMDSDSYSSDAESITVNRLTSTASITSEDSVRSEPLSSPSRELFKRRRGKAQKKRFLRTDIELATVFDTENENYEKEHEAKENGASSDVDADESVTISPFPEHRYTKDSDALSSRLGSISEYGDYSDDLHRTRILNPLMSPPLRPWKQTSSPKPKKKTPHVLTKPKVQYSPSLASLRYRRRHLKSSKKKPHHHAFKYSDAVETALRSLNSSPEGRRDSGTLNASLSMSPDLPGLDLEELLQEVIQRPQDRDILIPDESELEEIIKPHRLYRERSFSDPITKPQSFISTLEQVREDDDSELRSVLRKNTTQYPAEKKTVQFFLPDIFMHANACTSRPTALR